MLIQARTDAPSAARTRSARRTGAFRADVLALVGIVVLGAVLRFATIAHQSYWVDEATTVHELRMSLGALLHQVRVNETTPPLYFLLAWAWAKVFGTGEAGLRSLSALLGTGLIGVAYLCGRELVSRWAGVLAAAFAALSPFMIWYSQEARSYMLFAVLCGLSFLFFARLRGGGGRRDLVLWAGVSILAVGTHFFAGFLIAPEALYLLWRRRARSTWLAVGAIGLAQLALVPLAAGDTSHPLQWIKAFPLDTRIRQIPVDFALSALYQSPAVTYGLLGALGLALAVAALLWLGGEPGPRRSALLAAVVAGFVILVPIALAAVGRDYVVPRNFIAAWIPLAVLLAAACTAPRTLPMGAALAVLVLGAFLYAWIDIDSHAQYQRPDWRGVAGALGSTASPRAIVAQGAGYAAEPLAIYLPRVPWQLAASTPLQVGEVDVVAGAYASVAPRLPPGVRLLASRTVGGFRVARFAVAPAWRLAPAALAARAQALMSVPLSAPAILLQRPHA